MTGIRNLFEKSDSDSRRVKKFEKLAKGRKKIDLRKIERKLLKPISLPEYTGQLPVKSAVSERTVKFVFDTDADMALFRRYFKISEYRGLNVRNLDLIIKMLEAIDEGKLIYEKEDKTLFFVAEDGEQIRL